ncbi:cell wall protein DAN4 [Echeneis naucrates]|uniref:cell wall protein DAN4 n=1 Tax=Echeneis naucrates TaxID=173247 RepID=UPI001114575D|nr:cell wall protein DAN4-like [Echeneis naucrates]
MSPLFMDTGCDPDSPGSLSVEDYTSNAAELEREGEGHQLDSTGKKRREKNRDAARKTRQKQTERADQLHEELQSLERINSNLQKEITSLKKELQCYTTALVNHEPYCLLRASGSSTSRKRRLSDSHLTESQTSSSSSKVVPQTISPTLDTNTSISTSPTSSMGLKTLDCAENTDLPPSASAPTNTALAFSSGSSTECVIASSSSPVTAPYSGSFCTFSAPHSLFSEKSTINSWPSNVTPVHTNFVSACKPSNSLTTAAQAQSGYPSSTVSANPCFNSCHSDILEEFLMKQTSTPPIDQSQLTQGYVTNVPHCNPDQFSERPNRSSSLSSISSSRPQAPTPVALTDSPQVNLEPTLTPAFVFKPSYSQQMTPHHTSLLSLLTIPSPLNISPTTSNSSDDFIRQPPSSLPLSSDSTNELSLSEFLEVNDWILNGTSNQ